MSRLPVASVLLGWAAATTAAPAAGNVSQWGKDFEFNTMRETPQGYQMDAAACNQEDSGSNPRSTVCWKSMTMADGEFKTSCTVIELPSSGSAFAHQADHALLVGDEVVLPSANNHWVRVGNLDKDQQVVCWQSTAVDVARPQCALLTVAGRNLTLGPSVDVTGTPGGPFAAKPKVATLLSPWLEGFGDSKLLAAKESRGVLCFLEPIVGPKKTATGRCVMYGITAGKLAMFSDFVLNNNAFIASQDDAGQTVNSLAIAKSHKDRLLACYSQDQPEPYPDAGVCMEYQLSGTDAMIVNGDGKVSVLTEGADQMVLAHPAQNVDSLDNHMIACYEDDEKTPVNTRCRLSYIANGKVSALAGGLPNQSTVSKLTVQVFPEGMAGGSIAKTDAQNSLLCLNHPATNKFRCKRAWFHRKDELIVDSDYTFASELVQSPLVIPISGRAGLVLVCAIKKGTPAAGQSGGALEALAWTPAKGVCRHLHVHPGFVSDTTITKSKIFCEKYKWLCKDEKTICEQAFPGSKMPSAAGFRYAWSRNILDECEHWISVVIVALLLLFLMCCCCPCYPSRNWEPLPGDPLAGAKISPFDTVGGNGYHIGANPASDIASMQELKPLNSKGSHFALTKTKSGDIVMARQAGRGRESLIKRCCCRRWWC